MSFILNENNEAVGFNFSFRNCSGHKSGIPGVHNLLGLKDIDGFSKNYLYKSKRQTKVPVKTVSFLQSCNVVFSGLFFHKFTHKKETYAKLICSEREVKMLEHDVYYANSDIDGKIIEDNPSDKTKLRRVLRDSCSIFCLYGDNDISAFWGMDGFSITVSGVENAKYLQEMFNIIDGANSVFGFIKGNQDNFGSLVSLVDARLFKAVNSNDERQYIEPLV